MVENKNIKKTPLSTLGEFGLISHLTKKIQLSQKTTIKGIGDDAAVLNFGEKQTLISTDILIEGVHFDLSYFPLKHLGYKAVITNLSDIYAMNAQPTQILVSLAVSNRFTLEAVDEIYEGINLACKKYKVDLIGGDTSSSQKGLILSITVIGEAKKQKIVYRKGAKKNDLLVVSGNLGGAYMGLQILEREKEVFKTNPNSQPDLTPYTYCVGKQLKPEARQDVFFLLEKLNITPTSMIDISDGLASEILHLAKNSKIGCKLYEDKIPKDHEMVKIGKELSLNDTTAALNGGEDYELLFTIPPSNYEKIKNNPLLNVIGHITEQSSGCHLITRAGQEIELTAQGWNSLK